MILPLWISRISDVREGFRTNKTNRPAQMRRLLLELLEERDNPAVYTVTNLLDDGSMGSLRWAIDQASEPSEIQFEEGLEGTIEINSYLEVDETITINGDNRITLDNVDESGGSSTFETIRVYGGDLYLNDITLTGGDGGNGGSTGVRGYGSAIYVYNGSSLTADGCTFSDNINAQAGGAIFSQGETAFFDCIFTGNEGIDGAAIYSGTGGNLIVHDSVFSNNAGTNGGAIYTEDYMNVEGSTFTGNEGLYGGAIYTSASSAIVTSSTFAENNATVFIGNAYGGAIYQGGGGFLDIYNATFSQNNARASGGAIYVDSSYLGVYNSTFYGNTTDNSDGGAIAGSNNNTTVANSIVVGNLSNGFASDYVGENAQVGSINNIFGTDTSGQGFDNTNFFSQDASDVIDTVLADNGGPTQTYAISDTSIAFNAGDNDSANFTGQDFDQRGEGFYRIEGPAVDIGAFELQYAPETFIVDTNLDVVDENDGFLSLREAITLAEQSGAADTIQFDQSLAGQTITLDVNLGVLEVTRNLVIDGANAAGLSISGDAQSGIFSIGNGSDLADVSISNLTLRDGYRSSYGGAIFADYVTLTLTSMQFIDNGHVDSYAGALYAVDCTTEIIDSYFGVENTAGQSAASAGGAINFEYGTAVVSGTTFEGITAATAGAIYIYDAEVAIMNSTFADNSSTSSSGGAIHQDTGLLTIYGSTFYGNNSTDSGGALYTGSDATIVNSTFFGNDATTSAGGI